VWDKKICRKDKTLTKIRTTLHFLDGVWTAEEWQKILHGVEGKKWA
jgi:hypothetical protein